MMLITKQIEKQIEKTPLYSTDGQEKKNTIVKFFTPWTNWTWYVFEGRKEDDGDYLFFGMVCNPYGDKEMGYFTLSQLKSVKGPFGLRIERDRSVFNEPYEGDLYE